MSGEFVATLRRRALVYLEFARESLKKGYYDFACFFSEQSAQLMTKALLYKLFGEYPKIHDIRELLAILSRKLESAGLENLAEEIRSFIRDRRKSLNKLEDAYYTARYGHETFSQEDGRECVEAAEGTLKLLEKVERCIAQ